MKRVSIFLVTAALIVVMAGCPGDDGGYPPDPPPSENLEIQDWYDLDAIRDNLAGNHILMNDLDSTTAGYEELASPTANEGKGWEPIENFISSWGLLGFVGTFDGQGHEIRNLFINRPDEDAVGLFSKVDPIYYGGVIKDIGVVNADVTGKDGGGGLVGVNKGTVSNSYSTGNVTGAESVGGLVGVNKGTVSNSYSTGNVTGAESVGGLVGVNEGTVSNSYSTCSMSGNVFVGGLLGKNEGLVSDSYATGSVAGNLIVGGLVGWNLWSTVINSYSTGNVTGEVGVGGLLGSNIWSNVINSYSTGSVTGEWLVGGLAGDPEGTMSNSYYNYDECLINGENIITIGALFGEDFDQWLANNKFLDVNDRLSKENGYYAVNNVSDFKQLLAFGQDNSLKFRLKNDLDLATEPNFYIPYFAGEFDGNGHKISNLSFNFDFVAPVGLFGVLVSGGKVTQVGAEDVNITGFSIVGGLMGMNWEGTVSDSYSTGSVASYGFYVSEPEELCYSFAGGLVGQNGGTVSNSYSTCNVTGRDFVGGLMGMNWGEGTVSSSYATGNVTGEKYVGGLVGLSQSGSNALASVSNSYATGSVTGNSSVGGLVGKNEATVSNSYSTGNVTGVEGVGGLVGVNSATVSNSFWDTETSGQTTSDGGTGKTTAEMQEIATFDGVGWDITVVDPGETNDAYTWNIVDTVTYPFLGWQS